MGGLWAQVSVLKYSRSIFILMRDVLIIPLLKGCMVITSPVGTCDIFYANIRLRNQIAVVCDLPCVI